MIEIKLKDKIFLNSLEGKQMEIEKVVLNSPIVKFRKRYWSFYELLNKKILSTSFNKELSKLGEEDAKDSQEKQAKEYTENDYESFGNIIMGGDLIDPLFKFLRIGDSENFVLSVNGEKLNDFYFDQLEDKISDRDLTTLLGGIVLNFLPLMRMNRK